MDDLVLILVKKSLAHVVMTIAKVWNLKKKCPPRYRNQNQNSRSFSVSELSSPFRFSCWYFFFFLIPYCVLLQIATSISIQQSLQLENLDKNCTFQS